MTDGELLARFAADDSSAFEELVRRHAGWIYQASRRQLGDPALADDATQAVFLVLIRKAKSLSPSIPLAAWLHRTTILTAREIARKEARRKQREEAVAMMRQEQTSAEQTAWMQMAPLLESLVHRLCKVDQQAILLRYYAQRDFADVAMELNTTESAARKRVERAIHKLRKLFAARGIEHSSDVLGATLLTHANAPVSAEFISHIAGGAGSQTARQIAAAIARKFGLAKMGLAGTGVGMIGLAAFIATAKLSPNSKAAPAPRAGTMPAWLQAIANAPSEAPTYPASNVSFDELIGHLQQEESRIKNLHIVHFRTTLQERSSYDKPWENTPAVWEGSAWFDGNFHGRCRVYLNHDAQQWYPTTWGKDLVWTENSNDYGFDGTEGRMIRLTQIGISRVAGKTIYRPIPGREGAIDSGLPMEINDGSIPCFTGLACSLQYILQEGDNAHPPPRPHESLAQKLLRYHHIAAKDLLMVQSEINGVKAVGIQTRPYPPPTGWEEWWFDPSRGYALVRYVIHNFSSTPHGMQLDATQWKEAAPGIWFPTVGTVEENYEPCVRYTFHADNVIANDPQFRPGIFQVSLPVGFYIQDRRKNPPATFLVLDDGEEQYLHKGEAVPVVKPDVPKPPAD